MAEPPVGAAVIPVPVLVVIDEPGPFLTLVAHCAACRQEVSRRRYDTREPAPVDLHAVLDAGAWDDHARACVVTAMTN